MWAYVCVPVFRFRELYSLTIHLGAYPWHLLRQIQLPHNIIKSHEHVSLTIIFRFGRVEISMKGPIHDDLFIPRLQSKYSRLITKQIYPLNRPNSFENRRFVLGDRHDSSLFWCTRSGPRDLTPRDWSGAWASLSWLGKISVSWWGREFQRSKCNFFLTPWNSRPSVG